MLRSFLDQYRSAGNFGDMVWGSLLARGEIEDGSALWNDAYGLARETMARARENVVAILDFLRREGYMFVGVMPNEDGSPGEPWLPPSPESDARLRRLRAFVGPLPLSLLAWWEVVGDLSLQGTFPDSGEGGESLTGRLPMSDPLVVGPLEYVLQQVEEAAELLPEGGEGDALIERPAGDEEGVLVELSPDLYHKANVSGGASYSVRLPDRRADTRLQHVRILLSCPAGAGRPYMERALDETFVEYLRRSFLWAGFPGYAFLPDPSVERLRPLFGRMRVL